MKQTWVEHIVEHNWSRLYENIIPAEADRATSSSIMGHQLFPPADEGSGIDFASTVTVRAAALSARKIERASVERKLLVLTNDGVLIGLLVPMSQNVLEFLVAQNLSRIVYNTQNSEREVLEEAPFVLLSDASI